MEGCLTALFEEFDHADDDASADEEGGELFDNVESGGGVLVDDADDAFGAAANFRGDVFGRFR